MPILSSAGNLSDPVRLAFGWIADDDDRSAAHDRRGMLLLHEPFWVPVSWEGHRWIDDHRQRARELGLLCPLGSYNSPVRCD